MPEQRSVIACRISSQGMCSQVFDVLDQTGFCGPCAIEIAGLEGETKTEQLVYDRISASVAYLKKLGRL